MCPTCSHTMQVLRKTGAGTRFFHCLRCGSLKYEINDGMSTEAMPLLVDRCRALIRCLCDDPRDEEVLELLHRLGIIEACLPEDDRPTPKGE